MRAPTTPTCTLASYSICLISVILVHVVDMLWSNSATFDTGGDQGIVHGFWGSNVGSVNANVKNPGWAAMRLQLRYWAIDSWDSGERAYVLVDDVEVWSFSRASSSGCSTKPWRLYPPAASRMVSRSSQLTQETLTTSALGRVRTR